MANSTFSLSRQELDALRQQVDEAYPTGQFVAIEAGNVIAAAPTHRALVDTLSSMNKSPKDMLILQAGLELPESVVILLPTNK